MWTHHGRHLFKSSLFSADSTDSCDSVNPPGPEAIGRIAGCDGGYVTVDVDTRAEE